jgi:hypothetical protein
MSLPRDEVRPEHAVPVVEPAIPNGAAAAAILAAGVGCVSVSICAWLGDAVPAIGHAFNWYPPTGPLSGVSASAISIWFIVWIACHRRWKGSSMPMGAIGVISLTCLVVAFLLSFPPIGDALQGK